MLREQIELSYSHVGLGSLTEKALVTLFANGLVKALVRGTDLKPSELRDARGAVLYPGFYRTHLKVRPEGFLEQSVLWDTVEITSDVKRWGGVFVESRHALTVPGGDAAEGFPDDADAVMTGSVVLTIDATSGRPQPSSASSSSFQRLPQLTDPPASLERFAEVESSPMREVAPVHGLGYERIPFVVDERCAAPAARAAYVGHTMLFSHLIDILDHAETVYLGQRVDPGFTSEMLARRSLLEREIVYFSMPRLGSAVEVSLDILLDETPRPWNGDDAHTCAAVFEASAEVRSKEDNGRVAAARTKKMIVVEQARQDIVKDTRRIWRAQGKGQR